MYAVNQIDQIINVQLYDYNLQSSPNWLDPYHNFAYIIYAGLGATMVISALLLLLGFTKTQKPTPILTTITPEKTSIKPPQPIQKEPQETITQPKTQPKPPEPPAPATPPPKIATVQPKPQPATIPPATEEKKTKTANKQTATDVNTCPSCKKTYGQPLVMLDFEGGKSKLVNVCPYCNQVLGDTEQKSQ